MADGGREAARTAWRSPGAIPILMLFVLGRALALVLVFNLVARENGVPFIPYVFWQSLGGFTSSYFQSIPDHFREISSKSKSINFFREID